MKTLSRLAVVVLIVTLSFVLTASHVSAADKDAVKYQSLNFTKAYFFYSLNESLASYNNLYGTNLYLEQSEAYLLLPNNKDGWWWNISSGIASVAVGGRDSNIEEAYYLTTPSNMAASTHETKTARFAFEAVLFTDDDQRILADDWIDQQLNSAAIENKTVIGDRTMWFLRSQDANPYAYLRVLGAPEQPAPVAPLPWWTILGIISGIIGVSTFVYRQLHRVVRRPKKA